MLPIDDERLATDDTGLAIADRGLGNDAVLAGISAVVRRHGTVNF